MRSHGSGAHLISGTRVGASWRREALAVGIILAAVALISWVILGRIEERARSDTVRSLAALLQTTREAYQSWFQERKNQLDALAGDPRLQGLIDNQLEVARSGEDLAASPSLAEIRALLRPHLERRGDLGFLVVAEDRITVASLDDVSLGALSLVAQQRPALMDRAFGGETVLITALLSDIAVATQSRSSPTLFVAGPVFGSDGRVVAVFCLRIDPSLAFTGIAGMGRLGKSGETYAFDAKARLITESRFEDELRASGLLAPDQTSVLRLRVVDPGGELGAGDRPPHSLRDSPLTKMAASAVMGITGESTEAYRDYRGVPVLGAWLWDPSLGFGLATELDEEEALGTFRVIRGLVILGSSATTVLTFFLVLSLVQTYRRSEEEIRLREQRLDMILRTAADGIITIDGEGTILSVNPAAEELFGYRREAVVGTNVSLLMPEPHKSQHRAYVERYLKTGEARVIGIGREAEGRRKDGSTFPAHLSVSEMKLGGETLFTGIVRDISDVKAAQRALLQARDEAQAANRAKSDFLSSMSHELRTPLNAILGFAELLLRESQGPITEQQRGSLDLIRQSGDHLLSLISDLLDIAKIEAGGRDLELVEVSPESLIDGAVTMVLPKCREKGLIIVQDVAPEAEVLHGDLRALRQILLNLLSNAVKFTPEGGRISVAATRTGERVRIEVSDTGVGVEKAKQELIFSEFYQSDQTRDSALGGTGIGLALTRRLVDLHGGSIGVESEPGQGSVFWFEIPIREVEKEAPSGQAPEVPQKMSEVGRRILVAEDNEVNQLLIVEILKLGGHSVTLVPDGEQAVEAARAQVPELILMDVQMPVMDGLEATRKIRAVPGLAKIPIYALTARVDEGSVQECLEAGCTGHFPKPIEPDVLLQTIAGLPSGPDAGSPPE